MNTQLLLGDEAIAQGFIDGGLSGCYAYPGTPSTEIMEYIQQSKEAADKGIHRVWSSNEKTAFEAALGMSYAGKRACVCFKHVGLNVAADTFMNAAITGVNGGLVVVVADDPSMHSSQNEQDSRVYAKFAMVPLFEPSNQQEAYDMAYHALEYSEKIGLPVMLRLTTRLAHSRAGVVRKTSKAQNEWHLPDNNNNSFILLPAVARRSYKRLLEKQNELEKQSETSHYNVYIDGSDKKQGIITTGIAYNYLMECYPDRKNAHPILKITHYPVPRKQIAQLYQSCDEILVIEEGYPVVEEQLRGYMNNGKPVHGRLDGALPRDGELSPGVVAKALGMKTQQGAAIPEVVKPRPPQLCQGCGHRDVAEMINAAIAEYGKGRVFSDIGCYTLTFMPPFKTIDTCVEMGASITMAKGAADAGMGPTIAFIGDSTFTHSGMTGLLDAIRANANITVVISDNLTTAMTGGQDSAGTNRIAEICVGLGVPPDHVKVINPLKKFAEENLQLMKTEMAYHGVSVIIPQRECIQTFARRRKEEKNQ